MNAPRCNCLFGGLAVLVAALFFTGSGRSDDKEGKADLDKIPKAVMDTLKGRFPKAVIDKWTREKEGADVVYDIEFKIGARKWEADIKENGTLLNFEKEIAVKDLPEAVAKAVAKRYPKGKMTEAMEMTDVKGKEEKLHGYEIIVRKADGKSVEITLAPDGKVLEAPEKEEKK
ncbi:MAG: PepSY-like domain-containing protein [Gemmataceae bacterium]